MSPLSLPSDRVLRRVTAVAAGIAVAGTVAAVWIAQFHSLTYLSGQDPMTFIRLARELLQGHLPGHEGRDWIVAPGFPAILAAAIAVFGPLAPYWTNAVLATAAIVVLWRVLTHLDGDRDRALVMTLATILLVLHGHSNNVYFLLYPFRETAGLLLTGLGLLMLLAGLRTQTARRAFAAGAGTGAIALAACLVRETSILGFAGLALWALFSPDARRTRWMVLGGFAAVWAGAAVVAVAFAGRALVSQQWNVWPALLSQFGVGGFVRRLLGQEATMRAWLFAEVRSTGLVFLVLGLWALRRRPVLAAATLIPAIAWYLLHSAMEVHLRYLLYTLFAVGPVLGAGLLQCADWVSSIPPLRPLRTALTAAVLVALTTLLLMASFAVTPWYGRRIGKKQLRTAVHSLQEAAQGTPAVMLTPGDRLALDLILSYTDMPVVEPDWTNREALCSQSLLTVQALNPAAHFRSYHGMSAPDFLRYYTDVLPVRSGTNDVVISLRDARIGLLRTSPWDTRRAQHDVPVSNGCEAVIWLDFRASPSLSERTITVNDPASADAPLAFTNRGYGITPLYVPADRTHSGRVLVNIHSATPFPRDPVLTVQQGDRPAQFDLDNNRAHSVESWLKPGFIIPQGPMAKYSAIFNVDGCFAIPMPPADTPLRARMAARILVPGDGSTQEVHLRVEQAGAAVTNLPVQLGRWAWYDWEVPRVQPGVPLDVRLRTVPMLNAPAVRVGQLLVDLRATPAP